MKTGTWKVTNAGRICLYRNFLFLMVGVLLQVRAATGQPVLAGAERTADYFPLLRGKSVGLVVNQTSLVNKTHLVDTLLRSGIKIKRLFAPEHGFRGQAGAGEAIASGTDAATGLPLVSLYGKTKKPTAVQLKDLDVVVYDIQDVGVRFYTFISTLHLVMEACAENHIKLMVLDRPNPNGFYVDGPVLDTAFRSFVGMDPVPVVYGMTPGEYASMLNGERWLKKSVWCDLQVIACLNYDHQKKYELPVPPSPNLRSMTAIYLYPSICFFEGTPVSVGRGTATPFMQIGYPGMPGKTHSFTPASMEGAQDPPYNNEECRGIDLSGLNYGFFYERKSISLSWLLDLYHTYPDRSRFFTPFFDQLAGTDELRKQIETGKTEAEIRRSWQPGLESFRAIRKKYLLYPE